MRIVYVRVDLGDPEDKDPPVFVLSPVPFLSLYGEDIRPTKKEVMVAGSYAELCAILKQHFEIPIAMHPPSKYFKPTRSERENEEEIFRAVPQGAGEPEWRMKARQALMWALEDSAWSFGDRKVSVNGKHCYSLDEVQQELESIAEEAGGKKRIAHEAYQPDYDVLVKEVLRDCSDLLRFVELPKTRKRAR